MNSYLKKTKEKLFRIFPFAKDVIIETKKNPLGEFETKIELIAPQHINFIAKKKEANYKKSVDRSYQAILRQIHKNKSRRKRSRHENPPYFPSDEAA